MAGKRTLDGNNAAYDMRSLGKHIEAVSDGKHIVLTGSHWLIFFLPRCRRPKTVHT